MFTPELPPNEPTWVSRCCPTECVEERKRLEEENKRLMKIAHSLAMLIVESGQYKDPKIREVVDNLVFVKISAEEAGDETSRRS